VLAVAAAAAVVVFQASGRIIACQNRAKILQDFRSL